MSAPPSSGSQPRQLSTVWRVATTPVGDLARGRITGPVPRSIRSPHGWPAQIRAAGLGAPITDLLLRVVARTRLWRREKEDVARELIAHFQDGLESAGAGADGAALVRSFGDPRVAARLIRRAKRRNRPLLWHAWRRARHAAGLLFLLAALAYAWFGANYWLRRPRITRNYAAELNAATLVCPESERAWPLYVRAIAAMEMTPKELQRHWGAYRPGDPEWPAVLAYLERNRETLDLIRDGAARPALGLILSDGIPADFDAAIRERWRRAGRADWDPQPSGADNPALMGLLLPHLGEMRGFARLLSADLYAALEARDADRVVRDTRATVGMAGHGCDGPFLISDLVGLAVYDVALADVGEAIRDHAECLPDGALIALAHVLQSFHGGGDLRPDLSAERMFFDDLLQRVYTDEGHGDGRLTAAGVRMLEQFGTEAPTHWFDRLKASSGLRPIQAATAPGRRQIAREYDRCLTLLRAGYDRPLWEWDEARPETAVEQLDPARYRVLHWTLPGARTAFIAGESATQRRDGVFVAIALELYHRRHDAWPDGLGALVPNLIPEVPPDRYDGRPLRVAVRDGRPVVYSIGKDRDDDGGRSPTELIGARPPGESSAEIGGPRGGRPVYDGDWILWPLPAREPLERDEDTQTDAPSAGAG